MRLAQLYTSSVWRNAAESASIALAGVVVVVLLTQRSFESKAVIKPGSSDPQRALALVEQLGRAARSVSASGMVVTSMARSAPDELLVSCRSEQQLLARHACEQIASEAGQPPHMAQLLSSATLPADDQTTYYFALALLLSLVWFALRLRQQRARRSNGDLDGWSVRQPRDNQHASQVELTETTLHSDIRELSVVLPANDQGFDAYDADAERTMLHPRPQPRTRTMQLDAEPTRGSKQVTPRIVFRVGGNPFKPDPQVLTEATLAQLHEVCEQLLAATSRQRVVRVASGVSSRYAKTQVTAQLSAMLAEQTELPVLALEGDIDAPALHKAMHLEAPLGLGLSEQLQRCQRQQHTAAVSLIRVEGNLHALVESRSSSPAALGLPEFEELVEQLRAQHDFIIVDGPVLDTWPDSSHLSQCIDDIVMVAASGTRLRDTEALLARHFQEDTVLGVITTGDWSQLTGSS